MYYRVLVASQRFHGSDSLTYVSADAIQPGQIVSVPLQRLKVLGIVTEKVPKPSFQTKPVVSSWPLFIPTCSLELLDWLKSYYPAPLGTIAELFTPPALGKKLLAALPPITPKKANKMPTLTVEQSEVVNQILNNKSLSVLLHGITGSGKTRVYLELALKTIQAGRSVIILTPEIGLTRQLLQTFSDIFGDQVLITHSNMTSAQRRGVWQQIAQANTPLIVLGPRSAIFSPLSNIGLVVMDEAHDGAYKQEQAPYYQTSRVAAQLARLHKARFIMGSATPLLADYFTFAQKQLPIIRMNQLALPVKEKTMYEIIDCRDKTLFARSAWLATPLLRAIDSALERQEQALLFLNRRGSARLVLCDNCGWQSMCPHCDVALTYHQDQHLMRCHSCNFSDKIPDHCPVCEAVDLVFRSIGTKALESEIGRLYPGSRVARFDRDTEKTLQLSNQFQNLHSGSIDIVIGTQSIAKGFDLPKLSVVGIVQADSGLQIPDYTSNERTFQLITQVSGRVGRGHLPGKLFLQSYQPDSPLIAQALGKDYASFYQQELSQRQLFRFPPYYFLLKITCSRASSPAAKQACEKIAETIHRQFSTVIIEGPTPRFIEKMSGRYAWHLIVKSHQRTKLLQIITILPSNTVYDLDPSDLL